MKNPTKPDSIGPQTPLNKCQDTALQSGWLKEGAPTSPTVPSERRHRRFSLAAFLGVARPAAEEPVASEPVLRRLSENELALVEAADLFNASQFRRTVGGIAKSLGVPDVSVIPLSGVNPDVVVTVAWEISWYQYRITADSPQPVRLAGRGQELGELEDSFTAWNAHMEDDGRIVPDIARL